jgi:hypothetical protein
MRYIFIVSTIFLLSINSAKAKNWALVIGGGGETEEKNMFFQTFMLDATNLKTWGWDVTISLQLIKGLIRL